MKNNSRSNEFQNIQFVPYISKGVFVDYKTMIGNLVDWAMVIHNYSNT